MDNSDDDMDDLLEWAGELIALVAATEGSSWGEMETRWAAEKWLHAHDIYKWNHRKAEAASGQQRGNGRGGPVTGGGL